MQIKIITIGKVKEKYIAEQISEYKKRISVFAKLEIVELKAESFGDSNKEQAKRKEGDRLLEVLDKENDARLIALDEFGSEYTSKEFSQLICGENRRIVFVIGGTLGFDPRVLERVDEKLALSKMTLLHEMARLLLFEQIYRGIAIEKGKKYHY